MKHCWKMSDALEELNISVRVWRILSRHSIKEILLRNWIKVT